MATIPSFRHDDNDKKNNKNSKNQQILEEAGF